LFLVDLFIGVGHIIFFRVVPVLVGALHCLVYAVFPLVFCVALLPGQAKILPEYFLTLFWCKSWHFGWALINSISYLSYSYCESAGEHGFIYKTLVFPMVTMLLFAMVSSLMYIIIHGRMRGVATAMSRTENAGRIGVVAAAARIPK